MTVNELAPELRRQGADILIALTHAREPNDHKLAKNLRPGTVDLILGGHDHFYGHSIINGTHVLRSGTDFKQLSYLKAWRRPKDLRWDFEIIRRDIVRNIPQDPEAAALVEKISSGLRARLEKPIGYAAVAMDARFTTVRLKESNMGNFVCDLMRLFYGADCTLMASGTIRGDQVYPPGIIRAKDLLNCFPFEDPCVVLKLSGKAILEALENSVSTYPALEGRFPQVSNITFSFDSRAPPSQRIQEVMVGGKSIELDRSYTMATRDYMARGKDGFRSLMPKSAGGTTEEVVSEEHGILISMLLRQYFLSLKVLGKWHRGAGVHKHFEKNVYRDLHACHPVKEPQIADSTTKMTSQSGASELSSGTSSTSSKHCSNSYDELGEDSEDEGDNTLKRAPSAGDVYDRQLLVMRKVLRKWFRLAGLQGHPGISGPHATVQEEFQVEIGWTKAIAPQVEGRIIVLGGSPEA